MARAIEQIMAELETAYAPQKQAVQERMNQLPGYYEAQRAGAETARSNAFQDITRQANARGVVYSGAPIQEQQRYVGERYLPALAQLSGQEGEQRYGLQQALGQLGERQLSYAQQIRQKEMELDEARRQFDTQLAAQREAETRAARAAASSGAGGMNLGSLLGGGGGGNNRQQAPAAPSAPTRFQDLRDMLISLKRTGLNYGQAASQFEQRYGRVPSGSAADLAFRAVFLNDMGALDAGYSRYRNG